MKNNILVPFVSLALIAMISCESESKFITDDAKVSVENGYLFFHNKEDFKSLVNSISIENIQALENLEKIEGFTSFNERSIINKQEKSPQFEEVEKIGVLNPFFEKIVNDKAIVRVENILYQFTDKYIKMVAGYNGSSQMRNELIEMSLANKKKNFFISEVKEVDFNVKNARGNSEVIRSANGETVYLGEFGWGYNKLELLLTVGRVAIMCENTDEPANTYWYECGYDYYYSGSVRSSMIKTSNGASINSFATIITYNNGFYASGFGSGDTQYTLAVGSAVNTTSGFAGTYQSVIDVAGQISTATINY